RGPACPSCARGASPPRTSCPGRKGTPRGAWRAPRTGAGAPTRRGRACPCGRCAALRARAAPGARRRARWVPRACPPGGRTPRPARSFVLSAGFVLGSRREDLGEHLLDAARVLERLV